MQTAATAIQEQVRILALQIGVRPAARQLGLNEDTVCSWAKRNNWQSPATKPGPVTCASNLQATTVGDSVATELAEKERETRLGLAKYAENQAKHLATKGKLKDSGHFKNVTSGAGILHKWDAKSTQANVMVNIALLGVDPGEVQATGTVVDNEA